MKKQYRIAILAGIFFACLKMQAYEVLPTIATSTSDEVRQVLFDSKGMMRMATSSGILKYDGYSYSQFSSNLKTPWLLPNNYVQCMVEDHQHRLWVGTNDGVARIDQATGEVRHYHVSQSNQRIIYMLFVDRDGSVWAGTDGGLLRYDEKTDALVDQEFCRKSVKSMAEDKYGNLYIGTWADGLYLYNKVKKSLLPIPIGCHNAYSLCFDDAGRLWVGSWEDGLRVIELPWNPKKAIVRQILEKGNQRIYRIVFDPMKREIWACSKRNVIIVPLAEAASGKNTLFKPILIPNQAASDFSSVATNGRGMMAVTSNYDGINMFSTLSLPILYRQVPHFSPINGLLTLDGNHFWLASNSMGLLQNEVLQDVRPYTCVARRRNGEIWAGNMFYGINIISPNGASRLIDNTQCKFLNENGVTALYEAKDGTMIIGQWNNLVVFVAGKTPAALPNSITEKDGYTISLSKYLNPFYKGKVLHITQDHLGRIWVSTQTNGILRIDGDFHHPERIRVKCFNPSNGKYPLVESTACLEDKQHRLWAITKSGGLLLWNEEKDCFEAAGERFGVVEDKLYAINQDESGALWLAADNYLIRLKIDEEGKSSVLRFYVPGNRNNVKFQENSTYTYQGRMYFGGMNGYVGFAPAELLQVQKSMPDAPIAVTDILLDGVSYQDLDSLERREISAEQATYTRHLTIASSTRKVEVDFSLLSYDGNHRRLYAYWLEGYNKEWLVCARGEHKASFENLPSGTYRLHLRVLGNQGEWQEMPYTIQLKMLPPWWVTWWASLLWLMLLGGAVYAAILWYRQRIKTQNRLQIARVFTNITHELLTPLSVISASIDVAKAKIPEENYAAIQRNVQRLNRLIRQVLEVDKSKNGRLKLLVSKGRLMEFVGRECENLRALAAQKNISIVYQMEEDEAERLAYFDADKMDKILYNLLSNAIKYSEEGGKIEVTCSFNIKEDGTKETAHTEMVVITVKDQGIGISDDKMKHLFSRFMDGDYRRMKTMGTGIGLSLTYDLVKLHHGKITCESEEGKGTLFTVKIPVRKSSYQVEEIGQDKISGNSHKDAEQMALAAELASISRIPATEDDTDGISGYSATPKEKEYKILVVEDNVELLNLMRQVLEPNFEVYTAKNGEQALNIVERKPLDIVISDVMMPVMDGVELTRRIKLNPDYGQLPVVLLTAKTRDEDRDAAYLIGADEYLTKPFAMDALQLRILNILKNRERIRNRFMAQTEFEPEKQAYSSPDTLFMEKAIACVYQHLDDSDFDRDSFAREMCMSSSSLYKKLRTLTGQNVSAFINSIKMKEACKMAKANPYLPVNEVYAMLGYNTPAYFTRLFKAEFGMTFKEYQDKILKENADNSN